MLDVDIEQRSHGGVPVSEAAELRGQVRDLTATVKAVLVNKSEKRRGCLKKYYLCLCDAMYVVSCCCLSVLLPR